MSEPTKPKRRGKNSWHVTLYLPSGGSLKFSNVDDPSFAVMADGIRRALETVDQLAFRESFTEQVAR